MRELTLIHVGKGVNDVMHLFTHIREGYFIRIELNASAATLSNTTKTWYLGQRYITTIKQNIL